MKISKAMIRSGKEFARGFFMVAVGWFIATLITTNLQAASPIIVNTTNGGQLLIDLDNPIDRKVFREQFANDPRVAACFERADFAIELMTERDAGVTQAAHLELVRKEYEKLDMVPWYVFVDVGRLVRDVHRSAGSNTEGFRYTDSDELWVREFKWCAVTDPSR
jgi:hypothetical protein